MPTTADSVAVADTLGTVDMPTVGHGAKGRQNAGALGALGPFGRGFANIPPRLLMMIGGAALVAVIAKALAALGVRRADVELVAGKTARQKVVRVSGGALTAGRVVERLQAEAQA